MQTRLESDREDRVEGGANLQRRPIPVVIVCRNNLALSKLAIKSVERQDHPVEILVVDNDSRDGTKQWLRTKRLATITAPEQWSLARCWNTALAALWRVSWDKALVLNNDVELRPDTVRMLKLYGGEFVTAVSVNTPEQLADGADEPRAWNQRPHPDFSCFMISKTVTDKIGWFDEECFPAYTEDSRYHIRMWRYGIRAVCIDVPFLHHGASTIKSAAPGDRARIERGAQKNRERFRELYGCLPGTPEYEALFSSENFGAER